jgi:glyoxylase-like metal-dependent hydrolase (beta-lactamase superfamily II)/rhodanese-related sulfurtransferase
MVFEQLYLGCLAQAAYLIGDGGVAAVVDPRRDVEPYLELATAHRLTIRYVVETHVHADFVSGHRELAARTGATIVFGRRAEVAFPHLAVGDGDELVLGQVVLRVLETPGHTLESISLLVLDRARGEGPVAVLTGDTLFIGDVGRPDLLAARGLTAEALAGQLYDSLHGKLLELPDEVAVYPAHGAGSLCGRNLGSDVSSTIGRERRFNYALQPMTREAFVRMTTTDLPELPAYFGRDAEINREGPSLLAELPALAALAPGGVRHEVAAGAVVLDTRPPAAFGAGHLPGSINVGLAGQFASWAGTVIGLATPIVLVAEDPERAREAQVRLARVGIEWVAGYLEGGIAAWEAAGERLATLPQMPADELAHRLAPAATRRPPLPGHPVEPEAPRGGESDCGVPTKRSFVGCRAGAVGASTRSGPSSDDVPIAVLDVRRPGEWEAGHIEGARHVPLSALPRQLDARDAALPPAERPVAVICQSGYRSSLAASLLSRAGYPDVYNVVGGMNAWQASGLPVATGGSARRAS